MSAAPHLLSFPAQSAPQSLVEKYRPARIQDFAGIATVKETMLRFVEQPRKSAWMFVGESGTGKSTMANLIAELIDAQLTFVPSQECTVDRLRWVVQICRSYPMSGQRFNLVLVDEADLMSKAARDYLLSTLDNLQAQRFDETAVFRGIVVFCRQQFLAVENRVGSCHKA